MCGMLQLLSSAGLGGLGTFKKSLTDADVKKDVNLYKKLYEALLRTKIEYVDVFKRENVKEINTGSNNESDTILTKPEMHTYIEMVNIVFNFLHFFWIGNWKAYLEVFFEFLLYCFRLNRHNYARNLSC